MKALGCGVVLAALCGFLGVFAQAIAAPTDGSPLPTPSLISDGQAQEIARLIETRLRDNYPLPKLSEVYAAALEQGLRDHHYHGLEACALASKLTQDLRTAHNDKHLSVLCEPEAKAFIAQIAPADPDETIDNGIEEVSLSPNEPVAYIRSSGTWRADQDAFEPDSNEPIIDTVAVMRPEAGPGG